MHKRIVLNTLALLVPACTLLLFANFAAAQQVDIAVGGSTLKSSSPNSAALNFQQPAEKNGTYVGVSADIVGFKNRRLGFNIETAWRYKQTTYPFNGETYRPIFTDVNVLFQPRIGKKLGLDLMAGVGIASTRFNIPAVTSCSTPTGGCINYTSSNHFMEHLGGGVRYYVWHNIFVRPEIHYYHIQNNVEFHSPNVFRLGASVGYTFRPQ
jgi:opacity protein-like surface antigen